MTLFKHTEPPKESGKYPTDVGERFYDKSKNEWVSHHGANGHVSFHYSPSPPKEIEEAFNEIDIALNNAAHDFNTKAAIHVETLQTLLKLRAE